jgi:rhodanese-related sulfurtransferase
MQLELVGKSLFATGEVGGDDIIKFKEALANSAIEQVVLVNSPGGDLQTGFFVSREIEERQLSTVVAGSCVSACSVMFIAGKNRTFSDAFAPERTYVGIHGAHNTFTKAVNALLNPPIYALFKRQMGDRFNADLIHTAMNSMDDRSALLRVFDAGRLPKRVAYHCRSGAIPRSQCTEYPGVDASNIGLVTAPELVHVDLPASMADRAHIPGFDLTQPVGDVHVRVQAVKATQCLTDACRALLDQFEAGEVHKAVAVPFQGNGLGYVLGRGSYFAATTGALYTCNHLKDKPVRLCKAILVDHYDVSATQDLAIERHAQALQQLQVPADAAYDSEQFGGEWVRSAALKTDHMGDLTPSQVDSVRLYKTQELAMLLKAATPPVLINVWVADESLPGSQTLVAGGVALADIEKDGQLQARFNGLLKLLAPDPDKELVFYSGSRSDWYALNSLTRAKALGWKKLGWYRGGLAAWKAAGLPTAPPIMQAVVN